MGRPPLPLGTYGKIRLYPSASGYRAMTKFRDHDGITRVVERVGKSKAAAERTLKAALAERAGPAPGAVAGDSRLGDVAEEWFRIVAEAVENGERSPGTADQYRGHLDRCVLPGLGSLRVREATVPRLDAFLRTVRSTRGTATAKTCRAVLSGILGHAVRHGALASNPIREVTRLEAGRKRAPRALTVDERTRWLAQLEADPVAVRKDLPDLSRFMLATGVRIGEALAVYWDDVDLSAATVAVNHTVIRVRGKGLIRKSTKTEAGERLLPLPSWVVDILTGRHDTTDYPTGPVFSDSLGGLRDPSNTRRDLRHARGSEGFAWVTSHVFRRTAATILDEAGLSARLVADHLGHARPSMTQDVYLGRKGVNRRAADALENVVGGVQSTGKSVG